MGYHVRLRFIYLLDYISLSGISKCDDRKKIIKIELLAQNEQNYCNMGSVICTNDLYSKKVKFKFKR